jgi:uncharacterized protein YcbX
MRVDHIYRYPVKGLSAEALEEVQLEPGAMLPEDRRFALAQADAPFDPAAPAWLSKRNFACLMLHERLAGLATSFDERTGRLAIRAPDGTTLDEPVGTAEGRARIEAFATAFLGEDAKGPLRLAEAPGHRFSDDPDKLVSLINLASIADLEGRMGKPLHPLRFRANIYFSGAPAWQEFDWIGRTIELGGATLAITARIERCAATTVNPETAQRDAPVPRALLTHYRHADLGVFGRVVEGGRVALGDALTLHMADQELPDQATPVG